MKLILTAAFAVTLLVQLAMPLYTISQSEKVLKEGRVYHFKTRPVDPADPFRGRYVQLEFEADRVDVYAHEFWQSGQKLYATLGVDAEGYATVDGLWETVPDWQVDYLEVSLQSIYGKDPATAHINLPFDRYYMEEHKAPIAEENYAKALSEGATVYARVRVREGKGVLDGILVNDVPIEEF